MPTKKESTATAVTETKTAKAAVKKTTGAATKTKAAAETAKKAAAQVKKDEAESAPSVAKGKKKNTVRAQKANAGAVKAKTEEVKAEPANITEEPKEVKETLKKAEPKKASTVEKAVAAKEAEEAKTEEKKPAAEEKKKAAVIKRPKAEVTLTESPAKEEARVEVKAEEPAEEAKPKAKKTTARKTAKTTKTASKTAKKTAKAEEPAAKDAEAKPKKTTKKTAAKKSTAKKAEVKEEVKAEETPASAVKAEEPAKAEVKAEPAKEAAPARKEAAPVLEEVREEVKVEEKPARKPVPELTEEKIAAYRSFPLDTLMEMANATGLGKSLDELKHDLANTLDVDGYVADSMISALNRDDSYSFEDDGFDVTVIPFVMDAVYQALPYKASAATDLEKSVHDALEMKLGEDGMKNADVYNSLMDLVRQVLEVGQKQNMNTLDQVNAVIPGDLRALTEHFMDVAYDLLPYWSYDDVKFYEGFIYAVLSQFNDLADLQNRAMMDVADLYIKHGDYGRGDADYNYVIRENQLKDQIYYRFANVYRNFDPQKAKSIAASSLQYVDGRYDYYPRIMEILNS